MYPLPSHNMLDCLSFVPYQTHWAQDPISRPLYLLFLCLRLPFAQITIQTPQFTALGSFRDLLRLNLLMATSSTTLTIGITLPNLFFKIADIEPGEAAVWYASAVLATRKQEEETTWGDQKLKTGLGNRVRPYLKKEDSTMLEHGPRMELCENSQCLWESKSCGLGFLTSGI